MGNKECFVIMPFSDKGKALAKRWDNLYEKHIKPAVAGAGLGYTCRRSLNPHGNFMSNIVNDLANAEVVIAVLTELRPNVMYELGVRNALRRRTIMIAETGSSIPSDLAAFIAVRYSTKSKQGREAFAKEIKERLTLLDSEEFRSDNPVADYLWKRAQDICDDWRKNENPHVLVSRITEVLPSYAFQLASLLNEIGHQLTYSRIAKTVRASLASSEIMTEVTAAAGKESGRDEKEIKGMLVSVANKTIEAIREESFLTIDTRPLLGKKEGSLLQLPYAQFPSVTSLLDYVWSSMEQHVESLNYGISWALRDTESDKVFKNAGRTWAQKNSGDFLDSRKLATIGIKPGMKLEAVSLSTATTTPTPN